MDHKKVSECIWHLEEAGNVVNFYYGEINLWPLIRMKIREWMLKPQNGIPQVPADLTGTISNMAKQFFDTQTYARYLPHVHKHEANLDSLKKLVPVDALFLSRVEDHTDQFDGKWYNRHLDPYIEDVKKRYSCAKIELISNRTAATLPRFEETNFIGSLDFLRYDAQRSIIQAFEDNEGMQRLNDNNRVIEVLTEAGFGHALTLQSIVMEGARVMHYIKYFKTVLEALRPKVVFQVCYYYEIAMGLNAACKAMGIPVVDLQHGLQGRYHGMYSQWRSMPESGYALLPDYFWCWGEQAANSINDGMPAGRPHKALVGGNLWLAKWLNSDTFDLPLTPATKDYIVRLGATEKVILVSLQPTREILPPLLLEAMKQAPESWQWLLRVHPRQKGEIGNVQQQVASLGLTNFEVAHASELPLYSLLKACDWNITQWSTVGYEALSFGVPTVIIHPTGKNLCKDYLDQGHFVYAENATALIDTLAQPTPKNKEEVPYIVTSQQCSRSTLEEIMAHHHASTVV